MSKEFVGYFAKIISDMNEVRHDKLFVKTQNLLNTTKLTDNARVGQELMLTGIILFNYIDMFVLCVLYTYVNKIINQSI